MLAKGDRGWDGSLVAALIHDLGPAVQGRILLLLARREEGVEIEEQPLPRIFGHLPVHLLFYT